MIFPKGWAPRQKAVLHPRTCMAVMAQVVEHPLGNVLSSGTGSTAYWLPPDAGSSRSAVQEWTDEEVYARLESLSQQLQGQPVLTLADIEAVLFDARFPRRLEPLAQKLLARFKAINSASSGC